MIKLYLILAGIFSGTAVMLGAFAAHGLKSKLSDIALNTFQTGVQYQMYHALALMLFSLLAKSGIPLNWASGFIVSGIILFSGSLYLLALTGIKFFGPITPLGGMCFIFGWCLFVYQLFQSSKF